MAEQPPGYQKIDFKTIILYKDKTLGIGAFGAVCKAKCDDLLCAAKIIHPTLLDPISLYQIAPHRQHRLPIRRFQLECEFMSTIRHPNIVQYLGTHQDPETRLPVLLMELMDDNLTHFLESSPQIVPYHIQVNICHDITLALSFLHSNNIVHRDLSSNNILMHGNVLTKVTDFGMARLNDINPQATHFTNTMCPGTDVYMPPEAIQDKPVYTEKIDCFSFGVITVQTLTREFPKPGDRQMTINDPHYPRPIKMSIPEIERRQNHINGVDPNHPLLPIALDCLKDADSERPSAHQLCSRVAALKETAKYKNACERIKEKNEKEVDYEEFQSFQQNLDPTIQQLVQEKEEMERQLGRVKQQLEESEQLTAEFGKRNIELEEQLSVMRTQVQKQDGKAKSIPANRASVKLRWREGEKAPCVMAKYCDAVVHNTTMYCQYDTSNKLYAYNIPSSSWSLILNHPLVSGFAIAVVDGLLTTVGGYGADAWNVNKLFSLIGEDCGGRWTEKFPPMPTKRSSVSALCTGTALIVAGGVDDYYQKLKTVEVLNTQTRQWHTSLELPESLSGSSLMLCDNLVYLLGGYNEDSATNLVYSCSLSLLLSSTDSNSLGGCLASTLTKHRMWNRVANLPVTQSTGVTLQGRLLAIGGAHADKKLATAVHQLSSDSWEVISHMTTPRSDCIAAVLPDNQLMVVGGCTPERNSVEFGREI